FMLRTFPMFMTCAGSWDGRENPYMLVWGRMLKRGRQLSRRCSINKDSSDRPTYRVFPDRPVHNHPVLTQAGRRFILCSCSSGGRKPHCETRKKRKDQDYASHAKGACNNGV